MRQLYLILFLLGLLLFLQVSCRQTEEFPDVPAIEYEGFSVMQSINGEDSLGLLAISFTDGDGDLGVSSNDSSVNYLLDIYEVINGQAQKVELPDSTINFNAYIPYLTPVGKYKAIKGTIYYQLEIFRWTPFIVDSVFFETRIIDRAMNQSNKVTTPVIILN